MIVDRQREGHQNAGDPGGGKFGNGQRTGPAQHQIGPFVGPGHVLDEIDTFGLYPGLGVVRLQLFQMLRSGLMHDVRTLFRRDQRDAFRYHLIDRCRAQTATEYQQAQRWLTPLEAFHGRRQLGDFRTYRIADPLPLFQHVRKAANHPVGDLRQHPVGETGNRILFMDHQRTTGQHGHHPAGEADVAAHSEHHVRPDATDFAQCLPEAGQQVERQQQFAQQPLAAQRREAHGSHLVAASRHQFGLHAVGVAHPDHFPATRTQEIRHRQPRKDVSAGTASHDQQGG